jgi:hypothetical protein
VPTLGIGDRLGRDDVGFYRIRRHGADELLYIGEGKIRDMVLAHLRRARYLDIRRPKPSPSRTPSRSRMW